MSFYTEMQQTATDMLTEFGQAVTLSRQTVGAYDTATGTSAVTVTTQTGKGVLLDYGTKDIDGTLILATDKQLLLSVTGITVPIVGDTATVNGIIYAIMRIKDLSPAGTSVMLDCNLRVA